MGKVQHFHRIICKEQKRGKRGVWEKIKNVEKSWGGQQGKKKTRFFSSARLECERVSSWSGSRSDSEGGG